MTEFIYECEDFLPRELCEKLIKGFESNPEQQVVGQTHGGYNPYFKRSTDMKLSDVHGIDKYTFDKIMDYMYRSIKQYIQYCTEESKADKGRGLIEDIISKSYIDVPQIQRSKPGDFYRWHMDATLIKGSRLLTYIVYLNDMEDDCGGTTDFLCGKSIKPKTGKLVVFPATWTYFHRGKRVEKGVKYILTSFVWSEIPKGNC